MNSWALIWMYSVAVVASSLLGGWLPRLFRLTHVRMQIALSFVGGTMLGIGLLHMLPHSVAQTEDLDRSLAWMLIGLLGMFFLIRTFHFHEHGAAAPDTVCDHHAHEHVPDHSHDDAHDHAERTTVTRIASVRPGKLQKLSSMSWVGVAFGLSLHAFLDGVALSAGVVSEAGHSSVAGLGVFLAVLLHKPLDALTITTLMQARQWTHRSQQIVNAGFAMTCPLGAWAFLMGVERYTETSQRNLIGIALAISAGVFLCISLSDLLPEVQFHRHDRMKLSTALLLGVLCAYAIRFLEPVHAHRIPTAVVEMQQKDTLDELGKILNQERR